MEKKMLIVYYSVSNGNTKRIAEALQNATGADIAHIDTVKPYTGSYDAIVEQGQKEVNRGYQPNIKPLDVNVSDYDVIAIGTPTWWYTMAPAVLTFLNSCDWSGKTVIPFQTHGGWPGHTIKDMKNACKGATFTLEKAIQFDSTGGAELVTAEAEIEAWTAQVKVLTQTYFGKPDENNLSDDINEAIMRSAIRNTRILLNDLHNYEARSELAWASAMAENGILKIGKVTDFQCHQIEHQLGAYTDCKF